jgi:hypothetical protein
MPEPACDPFVYYRVLRPLPLPPDAPADVIYDPAQPDRPFTVAFYLTAEQLDLLRLLEIGVLALDPPPPAARDSAAPPHRGLALVR